MFIDKEIIKERKKKYGDNFEKIAKEWRKYLVNPLISSKNVATMMSLMKKVRLDFIEDNNSEEYKDTLKDLANYSWIAENFEEYEKLWKKRTLL